MTTPIEFAVSDKSNRHSQRTSAPVEEKNTEQKSWGTRDWLRIHPTEAEQNNSRGQT